MAGKVSYAQVCKRDPAPGRSVGSVGSPPPADGQTGRPRGMAEAGQPRDRGNGSSLAGAAEKRETWGQEGTCSS